MSDSQPFDTIHESRPEIGDAANVDAWIRAHVGRQIVAGCSHDIPETFVARLRRYTELRVAPLPSALVDEARIEAGVASFMRLDPHILLFWVDATTTEPVTEWASRLYRVCERVGALDLCLVALVGPAMTRAVARRLSFEEGFAEEVDEAALIGEIVAQAATREDARRRGSSPPCYL